MEDLLKYKDDNDRCFGATGMAIGLVIYDGDGLLSHIDLDAADGDEMLALTPDFYFAGNPGISARSAWNRIVRNYNIGVGMLIANLMCRHLVGRNRRMPAAVSDALRAIAAEEGVASCQLDDDEIKRIFDKSYAYLDKVFSHRGVQSVAHDFAAELSRRRSMSRLDVLEQLQALNML